MVAAAHKRCTEQNVEDKHTQKAQREAERVAERMSGRGAPASCQSTPPPKPDPNIFAPAFRKTAFLNIFLHLPGKRVILGVTGHFLEVGVCRSFLRWRTWVTLWFVMVLLLVMYTSRFVTLHALCYHRLLPSFVLLLCNLGLSGVTRTLANTPTVTHRGTPH